MALNRSFSGGSTILADHILQLIKLLEGDAGQGQAVSLVALDSGSAYALDVRNLGAGGALRVRDTTGNISLTFADAALTYALGTITTDAGLRVTSTLNAAGVAFVPVDVNITRTAAAAGARLFRVRQDGNAIFEVAAVASAGTGIAITPAAAASRVGLAAISTGTNEGLDIDAKGSGTIRLGNTSTGSILLQRATTVTIAATETLTALSGASGTGASVHVGRTAGEARLAVASTGDQWGTGLVAGDAMVRVDDNTKQVYVGAGSAEPCIKVQATRVDLRSGATTRLVADGTGLGFYGSAGVAKGTVTGSRGGNAALASLLTVLSGYGLLTDSSTA